VFFRDLGAAELQAFKAARVDQPASRIFRRIFENRPAFQVPVGWVSLRRRRSFSILLTISFLGAFFKCRTAPKTSLPPGSSPGKRILSFRADHPHSPGRGEHFHAFNRVFYPASGCAGVPDKRAASVPGIPARPSSPKVHFPRSRFDKEQPFSHPRPA